MTPILLPIQELKPALAGLARLNDRSSKLPFLQFIKIERTKEGWITLTRTEAERFITVRMEQPAQGTPVAFTASYEYLAGLVKNAAPKETIALNQNPDQSISASFNSHGEQMEVKVPSLPIQDFPPTPRVKGDPVPVPGEVRHAILEAMECVSEDPTRQVLNGVFIDTSQPKAHHVIATDGRHLFSSNSFTLPFRQSFILPKHKFLGWREFLNDGEWQMRLTDFSDTKTKVLVQLSTRRWRFITTTFEGQYPNWRAVLIDPVKIKTVITIDPQKIENLMAKIESLPSHNPVHHPIGIELVNGKLVLLGKEAGAKEWVKASVDYVKVSGPDVTVFLNRHLLIKALRFGMNEIGIADSISPVRLNQGHKEMIIMPTRADPETHFAPGRSPAPAVRTPRRPRPAPVLNDAFVGIKTLKDTFRAGLDVLRSLASSLKEVRRTQKENERGEKRMRKNPAAVT